MPTLELTASENMAVGAVVEHMAYIHARCGDRTMDVAAVSVVTGY